MYKLKGFAGIETLISNVPGVVSQIGELSPYSLTYSKDVGIYVSDVNRIITLYSFYSNLSTAGAVTVPADIVNAVFEITNWIYQQRSITTVPITKSAFLTALTTQFQANYSNINIGEIVATAAGYLFPESVTFKRNDYAVDNEITIWLSDAAFRLEYDIYEIVVIPPLDTVDAFFGNYADTAAALAQQTLSSQLSKIQAARGHTTETVVMANQYSYVNPLDSTQSVSVPWALLIYGSAGSDSDKVKAAIVTYILANSAHTELQWRVVFPDLFLRTEFVIFPRWFNTAIPSQSLVSGIYSSLVDINRELTYVKTVMSAVDPAFVNTNMQCLASQYKSLMLDVLGSTENRNGIFKLTTVFPDIINVPTTSLDFNRMSLITRGLMILLGNMLPVAETMTANSEVPSGMLHTTRNGIVYVSATYNNINFLISSKLTTPAY